MRETQGRSSKGRDGVGLRAGGEAQGGSLLGEAQGCGASGGWGREGEAEWGRVGPKVSVKLPTVHLSAESSIQQTESSILYLA